MARCEGQGRQGGQLGYRRRPPGQSLPERNNEGKLAGRYRDQAFRLSSQERRDQGCRRVRGVPRRTESVHGRIGAWRQWPGYEMRYLAVTAAVAMLWVTAIPALGQAQSAPLFPAYKAPRTADGKPDLNGIWQSFTTANWDILTHEAQPGPHPEIMGAWGAAPGGQGIVEGNEIPYQPWAAAKQKENFEKRMVVKPTNDPHRYDTGEPELQCYRPGVPRANYMPFPFQIFQTPGEILMVYEYKGAVRTIYMDPHREPPTESWLGWSNGRWEGNTL